MLMHGGARAGFAPLPPHPGPHAALLITTVGIEEAARVGLYKLNKYGPCLHFHLLGTSPAYRQGSTAP